MASTEGDPPRGWRFIDLAALGTNSWRSYLLTLLCIVLLPLAFVAACFVAIYIAAAAGVLPEKAASVLVIGTAFGSVVVAGAVLAWRVARGHRRPWRSLISPALAIDWRRLAIGAAVEAVLLLIFMAAAHSWLGETPGGGPAMTLPAMLVAMALTPFQAASEEMLFRGYLTQALGRVLRSRGAIAAIVGVLFGAAHFNAYGPLTLPYLFVVSLIFSAVSLRDERLELTIGAHAATNWVAAAGSYAMGVSPLSVRLSWPAIVLLLANGALFYGLTRALVGRLPARSADAAADPAAFREPGTRGLKE